MVRFKGGTLRRGWIAKTDLHSSMVRFKVPFSFKLVITERDIYIPVWFDLKRESKPLLVGSTLFTFQYGSI